MKQGGLKGGDLQRTGRRFPTPARAAPEAPTKAHTLARSEVTTQVGVGVFSVVHLNTPVDGLHNPAGSPLVALTRDYFA